MSMRDRAAQFSPFSALTGFGDSINKAEKDHNTAAENMDFLGSADIDS